MALLVATDGADDATMHLAARSGLALISDGDGLSSLIRRAERAGIAAHPVDRAALAPGADAEAVVRALDRAAFEARRDGTALFLGRADAETIGALSRWRRGLGAQDVALAPASAVLARRSGR